MFFKRMMALFCALLLLSCHALAQDVLVEGEIALESDVLAQLFSLDAEKIAALSGEITVEQTGDDFSAQWDNGFTVSGSKQEDGATLLSYDGGTIRLPALNGNPLNDVHAWLDQIGGEKTYANAVYSSLFTRALSVDLTGDTLSPILQDLWAQFPLLSSVLGNLPAQNSNVWGNLTRYKGDEQQYPDLSLLVLSLHVPSLPNIYVWLRSDEFGTTCKFAVEKAAVTDWDETLLTLEEGKSETGFIVNGFTLNFEDDEEKNIYIEATLITPACALTVECDYYLDYTGDYLWAIELYAHEEALGDVAEIEVEATLN